MATHSGSPTKSFWPTLLLAGLLAGSIDLIFAIVYYGKSGATAQGVMQSIAGGLMGRDAARQGGVQTAMLGVALHYLIAFIWAAIYFAASRRLPVLIRYAIPCGLVFGALVYFFMNGVVLPLSALHAKPWPIRLNWWVIAVHVFGVGLPIALIARGRGRSLSTLSGSS